MEYAKVDISVLASFDLSFKIVLQHHWVFFYLNLHGLNETPDPVEVTYKNMGFFIANSPHIQP